MDVGQWLDMQQIFELGSVYLVWLETDVTSVRVRVQGPSGKKF